MDKHKLKSELGLELFSFNYSLRAGAGAFRLQYLLPEMDLELMGSEILKRAGAYKLQTFLPELELELRVLDKNVGSKSGTAKVIFQIYLETHLKLYFSIFFLVIITTSILMSNNTRNLLLKRVFQILTLPFLLNKCTSLIENPN